MFRSRSRPLWVLCLVALIVGGVPGVSAALSDTARFTGDLAVPQDFAGLQEDFFVLSGAMDIGGDTEGPVFLLDDRGSRFRVPLLRLYDMGDEVALARSEPVLEIVGGTLEPDAGADFLWAAKNLSVDARSPYSTAFLFDLLSHVDPALFDYTGQEGPFPPTVVSTLGTDAWSLRMRDTERSFYFPLSAAGFTLRDAAGEIIEPETTASDTQWLVSMRGVVREDGTPATVEASLLGAGAAIPLEGGVSVAFAQAEEADFHAGFSVDAFAAFIERFLGLRDATPDLPGPPSEEGRDIAERCAEEPEPTEECRAYYEEYHNTTQDPRRGLGPGLAGFYGSSPDDPDPLSAQNEQPEGPAEGDGTTGGGPGATAAAIREGMGVVKELGVFANGLLVGNPRGQLTTAGSAYTDPGLTILRFTELSLHTTVTHTVGIEGRQVFTYADSEVPHDTAGLSLGPIFLPLWSIALWLVAIGALLASRYWSLRDRDDPLTHRLAVPAVAVHVLLAVVAFVLFDLEVRHLIGTSFLTSIGIFAASPGYVAATAVGPLTLAGAELGLWGFAWVLFGLPVKLVGRSVLLMAGLMKPTWHFAAGLGAFCTWLFGAPMIVPLVATGIAIFT